MALSARVSMGRRGAQIVEEAERQIIKLEERGYDKRYSFIQQAWNLVEGALVRRLCSPEGKKIETICLVIPPGCLHPSRMIKMIGSGKCLMSQVDLASLKSANKISVSAKPYIICNLRAEQTADIGIGRRHTTLEENMSWCVVNYPDAMNPETAYFALNSRVGKQPIGIELDNYLNPKIITSMPPLSKIKSFALSCERDAIV